MKNEKSACIIVLALLLFITGLSQVAGIPREETLIVDVLSGRAGSPVILTFLLSAWRNPDRGIQQLILEPYG